MGSDRFARSVTVQAILLALSGGAAVFVLAGDYIWITKMFFPALWVLQILILIRHVNRTNRYLENFLLSLRYLDKVSLPGSGKSFRNLNQAYNQVTDRFREERSARESEYHFFRETVEHIPTGLISFHEDGTVTVFNRAAGRILKMGTCTSLDQLGRVSRDLPEILRSLEPGRPRLFTLKAGDEILKLSLNLALMKLRDRPVRIVSITDIKGELEAGELDAWQKLIRILTHEIVNSVTPINTLTTAMISQLEKAGYPDNEHTRNLAAGFQAIRKRNTGLLNFVENYQKVNKIPKPDFQPVQVVGLFDGIGALLQEEHKKSSVTFSVEENFRIEADEALIMQVMINLIKNAVEAGASSIEIGAGISAQGRPRIVVSDNGHGIDQETLDQIFIPFYSSKKQGSGIGLSLARQIMRLHRGEIFVDSTGAEGTRIVLHF